MEKIYCLVELEHYGNFGDIKKPIQCSENKKELESYCKKLNDSFNDLKFEVIELWLEKQAKDTKLYQKAVNH